MDITVQRIAYWRNVELTLYTQGGPAFKTYAPKEGLCGIHCMFDNYMRGIHDFLLYHMSRAFYVQ